MSPRSGPAPVVVIRDLRTHDELLACVELQKDTWGRSFTHVVPPSILKIAQRLGGVVAGAFDAGGGMVGFVFGMTGVERGRIVHWSDMLAVRPELRDQGIGQRLKHYQKEQARRQGAEVIYWTYDPLVARNAHLNLTRLGARIAEYVESMYGPDTQSDLHSGLGTDRFIVAWDVADPPGGRTRPDAAALSRGAPVANAGRDGGEEPPLERFAAEAPPVLLVEIPLDIHAVRQASPAAARRWRSTSRAALVWGLSHGYGVAGFARDDAAGRGRYVLALSGAAKGGR